MTHNSGRISQLPTQREPNTGLMLLPTQTRPPASEPNLKGRYKAALFDENGMILTLVSPGFGRLRGDDRSAMIAKLQEAAKAAGLFGTVIPVWKSPDSFEFVAPPVFGPILKSLQWTEILERVDSEFSC